MSVYTHDFSRGFSYAVVIPMVFALPVGVTGLLTVIDA